MSAGAFAIEIEGATLTGERRWGTGGPPLVLVHGFGGSRHDWAPLIAALPPSLSLVTYDQRGFGDSFAVPGEPFSHAQDLVALLDALELDQVDLCGVSLGGATVIGGALDAPERVRRLILVSPMLAGWSWSPEWIALWKAIGRAARDGDIATARTLWWEHPLFATTREGPHGGELMRSIAAFSGAQWVRDDQRDALPMVERLHDLDTPTLLLTGALDLPDFRLMADLIEGAAPRVSRVEYPDAGHMLTLEKREDIAGEIAAFLAP